MEISIIIPTLNEEKYLPFLLDSINKQNVNIKEIIVSDGFSTDRTRQIAEEYGCIITDGPEHPGTGRNRGAEIAKGDLFIFIDADIILPERYLEKFLKEFNSRDLGCATGIYHPIESKLFEKFSYLIGNSFIYLSQCFSPFAAGYFIAVRRDVFEKIGGFDETLLLAEDHDFVKRASKIKKFRVLWMPVLVSIRRYSEQGKIRLAYFYIKITLMVIFGRKIKRSEKGVVYNFGEHE